MNIIIIIGLGKIIALLFAFTFIYGVLKRRLELRSRVLVELVYGLAFAIIAIMGMKIPIELEPGIMVDGRVIVLALAAPFGGPWASVIAGIIVSLYRYSIGGMGVYSGIAAILAATLLGLLFQRRIRRDLSELGMVHFLVLGSASAVLGLLISFCLPDTDIALRAFINHFIPISIFYTVSAVFLGTLLVSEVRRMNTEQALRESEKCVRGIVDSMAERTWEADLDGRYTYCSENVESLLGYTPDEMIGKTVFDFMAPDQVERIRDVFKKAADHKTDIKNMENWNISKEGRRICLLTNGVSILNENGDLIGFHGVDRDITESKLADTALRKSEEKHRKLVSNISDVIVILDADGMVKYKSPNIKRLFGWEPEELVGRHGLYTTHPGDKERIGGQLMDLIRKEQESVRVEYRYLCKNGNFKPVELTAINMMNDPSINGVMANYRDISQREQANEKLRKSEEKFRTAFKTSPNAITLTRVEDGTYAEINEGFTRIMGYSPEDVIGKSSLELDIWNNPKDRDLLVSGLETEGLVESLESEFKGKAGQIINGLMSARILNIEDKGYLLSVTQDITELKQADRERLDLEIKLQQAQKMESIGTLAGGIAHDFNNILFPILGYSEMLLEDIPEDSPSHSNLKGIYTGALRAKDLVKQILTFSRQESHHLKLMKIQPVIRETLRFIRSTIPATIDIKQDIQANCGVVKADPTQIHQIIMNLTTNAYHAMRDTGGELNVSLREIKIERGNLINHDMIPGDYACLTVADEGVGMDKDITKKIFDPFFTTKEKGEGTGMGLSVVHGTVSSMGGSIRVNSEPGKGTVFKVYIPVENWFSGEQKTDIKPSVQGGPEHILLVDDEESIIMMETQMLERMGYKVTARTSSIEALEVFRASPEKFDLVITDMAMPNLSGDKLAVELTNIHPDIPILLCTGFSENILHEKKSLPGIKNFLMKPIIRKELSQKIREMLDKNVD